MERLTPLTKLSLETTFLITIEIVYYDLYITKMVSLIDFSWKCYSNHNKLKYIVS